MENETLVTDGETAEVDDSTLADGKVAKATLADPQNDAEKVALDLADMKEQSAKLQDDLNRMKSSNQKREAQTLKDFETKESNFKKEIQNLRLSGLNDEDKVEYEKQLAKERLQELQTANEQLVAEKQTQQARQESLQYFLGHGIDQKDLSLDGDYSDLVKSGWDALTAKQKQLEDENASLRSKKTATASGETAPDILDVDGVPAATKTWAELVTEYGSEEAVYTAVESGDLPASEIP